MHEAIDFFIKSISKSQDFTTAYAHLLRIAQNWADVDMGAAKELLQRLDRARPGQPRVRELLERYFY